MKKLLFTSAVFTAGTVFGLAFAAIVAFGFLSSGSAGPISETAGGGEPDVKVVVSQQHINSLVSRQAKNSTEYRNLRVRVEPDNTLVLTGDTTVAGFSVPVQVKGRLVADGDGIRVKVVETKLGVFPVDVDLSGVVEEPIASATKAMIPSNHYRISGVTTQVGSVVIELKERSG